MYGDLGVKLVQHAKRTQKLEHLPPYQTELVRSVAREVRELNKECTNLLEPLDSTFNPSEDPNTGTRLFINHLYMRRNKRCLLAYHKTRTDKLEEMVWNGNDIADLAAQQRSADNGQGNGAGIGNGEGNSSSLSPEEEEYVRQYGELLSAYKGKWTDIDLTGSLEPPRDLFIDVRVLKNAGEIQTEYGTINLTKNSQFFVRQGDVERLIAQGYLQKLN
ncbi:DNA replication complex GINS protein PSF1 [Tricladium varicosporioides]|nr:DNA replication complex GINS protein PSF1 [Hymenoscyphus varicosporioides]